MKNQTVIQEQLTFGWFDKFGIWRKTHAIYPLLGGTASAHKFNLKDPRDLNAAYRLKKKKK
jgi:hypothetical protein